MPEKQPSNQVDTPPTQKKKPKTIISNSKLSPTLSELKNSLFKEINKILDKNKDSIISSEEMEGTRETIDSLFSKLLTITERQILHSKERRPPAAFKRVGEMWMFSYRASTTQKYYDSFPCIILLELYTDGFLGLNLHYLPEKLREILFVQLYQLRTSDNLKDELTRMKLRYDLIYNTLRYRYAAPCIKRYKYSNIDSMMIKIPAEEWMMAMYLPTWNFMNSTRRQIWMDSRKKIMQRGKNIGDIK